MKAGIILLAVLVYGLTAAADPRLWDPRGVPVRQGTHVQWERAVAQDAAGNTLAVWADARTGTYGIYAQLIGPQGNLLWPDSGIVVELNDVPSWNPVVCAVDGGWIVAWLDYLNPFDGNAWELEIWAQKIDPSGTRLWADGGLQGVPVDTVAAQTHWGSLHVVDDGNGGALFAWLNTYMSWNVKAQRVGTNGQRVWPEPLAVTALTGARSGLAAAPGDEHNLLLTWADYRNTPTAPDIYAAKVTPTGETPWGANGVAVSTAPGNQYRPQIATDGAGGAYVTWSSLRYVIQRLDAAGQPLWGADGIQVSTSESQTSAARIATSRTGGAPDGCFVVWPNGRDLVSQKFSPAGVPVWAENGVPICTSGQGDINDRPDPRIVSDLAGGLVCVRQTYTNSGGGQYSVRGKRLGGQGETVWGGDCGVRLTELPNDTRPALAAGTDRCTVVLQSGSYYGEDDLLVQQLSLGGGARLLGDNGSRLLDNLGGDAGNPALIALSDGRAAVVWDDWRPGNHGLMHFQMISRDGGMTAVSNGEPLVTDYAGYSGFNQQRPQLCADNAGGFFCVYEDMRTGIKQIRLSQVNAAGDVISDPAGVIVWNDPAAMDQGGSKCVEDGRGGCYVAWTQYNQQFYQDAYVMHISAAGLPAWTQPVRLTDDLDDETIYDVIRDGGDGCIIVLQNGEFGNFNLAAARVSPEGLLWNTVVCDAPRDQEQAALLPDGHGGAYVAWKDRRRGSDWVIYAQRMNAAGNTLWGVNGIAVVTDTLYKRNPQLAAAPGGVYVVWEDFRSEQYLDIYAQRLTAAGDRLWPESGLPLCVAEREQSEPRAWSDGYGNLFVIWSDARNYSSHAIYGISVWPNGEPVASWWVPQMGGPISTAGQWNSSPELAGFGDHFCYVVWQQAYYYGDEGGIRGVWAQLVETAALSITEPAPAATPARYALEQNYPNPFNPLTHIQFALPEAAHAKLMVYNLLGQEVARLWDAPLASGVHTAAFDARAVPSGVYFYRLEAGAFAQTRKMVLLR